MKRSISSLALAAALVSLAPLAAAAADVPTPLQATSTIVAPGASFEIIDKATGDVIGTLVSVGANAGVIAAMADRARAQQRPSPVQVQDDAKKTPAEWSQFWNQAFPLFGGG